MKGRAAVAITALVAGFAQVTPADAAPVKAAAPNCQMIGLTPGSYNAFAKLDGINGDSASARHVGEIDINALRFCVTRPSVGRPMLGNIVLGKVVDSATPQLASAAQTGKLIKTARITVEKPGVDTSGEVLRLDLLGVHVVDSIVNTEDHGIGEEVTLTAGRFQLTFTGKDGKNATSCYDFNQQMIC